MAQPSDSHKWKRRSRRWRARLAIVASIVSIAVGSMTISEKGPQFVQDLKKRLLLGSAHQQTSNAPAPPVATPEQKKKEASKPRITTGSISKCYSIEYVMSTLEAQLSENEKLFADLFATRGACFTLPISSLANNFIMFTGTKWFANRPTVIVVPALEQSTKRLKEQQTVRIEGDYVEYRSRPWPHPDVIVVKDGRVKE
jgi:hypothetical protein